MFRQEQVFCPVGNHAEIGIRTKGQSAVFICRECNYAFPVDKTGNFLAPIKLQEDKKAKKCGCGGCQR